MAAFDEDDVVILGGKVYSRKIAYDRFLSALGWSPQQVAVMTDSEVTQAYSNKLGPSQLKLEEGVPTDLAIEQAAMNASKLHGAGAGADTEIMSNVAPVMENEMQPMIDANTGQPVIANTTIPMQPAQGPTLPANPNNPPAPVAPGSRLTGVVGPNGQPMAPGQPVQPVQPGQPVQPMAPGQPVQPMAPGQPVQPMAPAAPAQPVAAAVPTPTVPWSQMKGTLDAAIQLSVTEQGVQAAKGLIDGHGLALALRAYDEDAFNKVYPEGVPEPDTTYGPVVSHKIIDIEVQNGCTHIITTNGVLTLLGNVQIIHQQ